MSIFFAMLMIVALWLILRKKPNAKPSTTEEIVQKYKNLAESRKTRTNSKETARQSRIAHRKMVKDRDSREAASRTELRLSAYLFFDSVQASRLVDGVQARYPDKTRQWCAEKALSDLERDRQTR